MERWFYLYNKDSVESYANVRVSLRNTLFNIIFVPSSKFPNLLLSLRFTILTVALFLVSLSHANYPAHLITLNFINKTTLETASVV
jgi:hypothetical protein